MIRPVPYPVPYKEHWAHSRTVTYDTMLITARCKA